MIAYNFKAAQQRIDRLKRIYRIMKAQQAQDGSWDWWIKQEIIELEKEMATAANSDHWKIRFKNIIEAIISRLDRTGKKGGSYGS